MTYSLRKKLTFGVTLIEACFFLMLALMVTAVIEASLSFNLEKKAKMSAQLFASMTKDAVVTYDIASLDVFVQEMMTHQDIVYARILDSSHTSLAVSGEAPAMTMYAADPEVAAIDDGIFDVEAAIVIEGQTFGFVQLGLKVDFIAQAINETQLVIAGVAAVEILFISIIAYFFSGYLVKQLTRLKQSAENMTQQITTGEPIRERIDMYDTDHEVMVVAESFNALVDALNRQIKRSQKFQNELFTLNANLEEQIVNRTAMLRTSNEKLKDINKDLKETQSQLNQAEKMASVGQLAAGVAHEINNPVGFVKSNLASLREYLVIFTQLNELVEAFMQSKDVFERRMLQQKIIAMMSEEDVQFLLSDGIDIIQESDDGLARVSDIVSGLKSFSRADDDTMQSFNINQCIETTLKMVHNQLKYHCEIETQLASDLPNIDMHVGKIIQVLTNLLVNAGHAVGERGNIQVISEMVDDTIKVTVADNGHGIEPEHLKQLFNPFFTTKPEGEGTGLGLSISFNIIKEHHGRIDVESEIDVGTKFIITLPVYV
jgi:C4-dicarboxylate-specific signal transduction histidine kinase